MKTYRAPWGTALRAMSAFSTILLVGVALVVVWTAGRAGPLAALAAMAIVAIAGLFTVRGYTVRSDVVLVQRLFWSTRVPLAGLRSVQFQPDVMSRSIRLFGNGGLYSFSGLFWNRRLGRYRAYVTDLHRTVVLRFVTRTVVLSPRDPQAFVEQLGSTAKV